MRRAAEEYRFRLDATYPFESPDVVAAVEAVVAVLQCSLHTTEPISIYDDVVPIGKLVPLVEKSRRSTIKLFSPTAGVSLGRIRNHNLTRLLIDVLQPLEWHCIVALLDRLGPVVSARYVDSAYAFWQNAKDTIHYRTLGRSMEGLPMKSNGLPFPLEQQVVDTSQNPGRRILRSGYVEAIGHRMWLGPEYFRRVPGADRDAVRNAAWLRVTETNDGLLEIVAADEPFTESTPQDVQDRLRRLLFPTTA